MIKALAIYLDNQLTDKGSWPMETINSISFFICFVVWTHNCLVDQWFQKGREGDGFERTISLLCFFFLLVSYSISYTCFPLNLLRPWKTLAWLWHEFSNIKKCLTTQNTIDCAFLKSIKTVIEENFLGPIICGKRGLYIKDSDTNI